MHLARISDLILGILVPGRLSYCSTATKWPFSAASSIPPRRPTARWPPPHKATQEAYAEIPSPFLLLCLASQLLLVVLEVVLYDARLLKDGLQRARQQRGVHHHMAVAGRQGLSDPRGLFSNGADHHLGHSTEVRRQPQAPHAPLPVAPVATPHSTTRGPCGNASPKKAKEVTSRT